jgi:DivIVA domain-containing protein
MAAMFDTVKGLKKGYDKDEVEDFFDHAREVYEGVATEPLTHRDIHTCVYDVVRGGYDSDQVDAAMNRLENAFVAKEKQDVIAQGGPGLWAQTLNERAKSLYPRLARPSGERFSYPDRGVGYAIEHVDALCANLVKFFDGNIKITASELRAVTFEAARGKNAYVEGEVDAFMARAIEVLLGVE